MWSLRKGYRHRSDERDWTIYLRRCLRRGRLVRGYSIVCIMPTKWYDMQHVAAAYHCTPGRLTLSSFHTISSISMKFLCSLDRLCFSCCSSVLNSLLQILHSLFVYFGFRLLFLQHAVIIAENIMADTIQVNHGIFIFLLRISSFGRSGYNRDSDGNTSNSNKRSWGSQRKNG